jgi:hypothetical protein
LVVIPRLHHLNVKPKLRQIASLVSPHGGVISVTLIIPPASFFWATVCTDNVVCRDAHPFRWAFSPLRYISTTSRAAGLTINVLANLEVLNVAVVLEAGESINHVCH